MLNISKNTIKDKIDKSHYSCFTTADSLIGYTIISRYLFVIFIISIIILFLPWTQNVQGEGTVTSLNPEHRPTTLHSVISGRITKWYVQEGDFVRKGDTILEISEIMDAFFDPLLIDRTSQRLEASKDVNISYDDRIRALQTQRKAIESQFTVKLQQLKNKLKQVELKLMSDSIFLEAAKIEYQIAFDQADRAEKLLKEGILAVTDTENRRQKLQQAQAKLVDADNKLVISRNESAIARAELSAVQFEFNDKIASLDASIYNAISTRLDNEIKLIGMENQLENIKIRTTMRHITAPQDGHITQAIKTGIGENVKEGEAILSIMPSDYELAVEFYIKPMDLPLLQRGQHARFVFDGWPAFVFSGWPNLTFGTFGGEIVSIDNFSVDGKTFRVLVKPDSNDKEWPPLVRVGTGAKGFVLLNDVPIWFELWRQLNGFPPNFYVSKEEEKDQAKSDWKAPIKKIK